MGSSSKTFMPHFGGPYHAFVCHFVENFRPGNWGCNMAQFMVSATFLSMEWNTKPGSSAIGATYQKLNNHVKIFLSVELCMKYSNTLGPISWTVPIKFPKGGPLYLISGKKNPDVYAPSAFCKLCSEDVQLLTVLLIIQWAVFPGELFLSNFTMYVALTTPFTLGHTCTECVGNGLNPGINL